jgi:hypothetical protein
VTNREPCPVATPPQLRRWNRQSWLPVLAFPAVSFGLVAALIALEAPRWAILWLAPLVATPALFFAAEHQTRKRRAFQIDQNLQFDVQMLSFSSLF